MINSCFKNNKNNIPPFIFICLIMTVILFIIGIKSMCNASTIAIEEYNKEITQNTQKIDDMETIKNYLHRVAELFRANEEINNGFDIILGEKWKECADMQDNLYKDNSTIEEKIKVLENSAKKQFIGSFKITHYCPCLTCNGKWGNKTALGTTMTPNKTIAVDPKIIPLGSKVEIQDKIYIAEDTGGAIKGNKIDICVSSHSEAYRLGVLNNIPVYIMN